MKVKKREIFEAEQWFPGKKVPGVQGADINIMCGCVITGGPANAPHIHPTVSECELVKSGDWIVTDEKGSMCLVKSNIFNQIYEKIK